MGFYYKPSARYVAAMLYVQLHWRERARVAMTVEDVCWWGLQSVPPWVVRLAYGDTAGYSPTTIPSCRYCNTDVCTCVVVVHSLMMPLRTRVINIASALHWLLAHSVTHQKLRRLLFLSADGMDSSDLMVCSLGSDLSPCFFLLFTPVRDDSLVYTPIDACCV